MQRSRSRTANATPSVLAAAELLLDARLPHAHGAFA